MIFSHIVVTPVPSKGITSVWEVRSKYDSAPLLGRIKWYSGWRKYALYPVENTLFEEICMRELAEFIEHQTNLQREKWKKKKTDG